MLLTYIPELLDAENTANSVYTLFELIIDGWLERESTWVEKRSLQEFSEKLAVEIFQNREKRGSEAVNKDELISFSENWGIKIERWKLTGRSLLNRDARDNYKFAHRSIMEFLFIKRLLKMDPNCYWVELTDQMIIFLSERLRWTEQTKKILSKKIKFLSAKLLWKIVDMKESMTEEKFLEFSQILEGIKFLEFTGILLTSLRDVSDAKLLIIGDLGVEFDKIIEKEDLGMLSVKNSSSGFFELNISRSKNPSRDIFDNVSEYLSKQLDVRKTIIRDALMFSTPNEVFLLQLMNYIKYFDEAFTQQTPIAVLVSENINLYKNKVLAVPLFDQENKFTNYVLLLFEKFIVANNDF